MPCPYKGERHPSGPPLRVLPRVVGLRPRCRLSLPPSARDQSAIPPWRDHFFPVRPGARQKKSIQSRYIFAPAEVSVGMVRVFFLNYSTLQLLNFSTIARGCPRSNVWSCNYFVKGATQEGVAKDTAGHRPRRPERGGNFPHLQASYH